MKFTRERYSTGDLIEKFEILMSHLQKLMKESGSNTLIKNTKLGEMLAQLENINDLDDEDAAALALVIATYNQINFLFDDQLDISFNKNEILHVITGQSSFAEVNDKSADKLFELGMATRFARASQNKVKINLTTACDIIIDSKIAIECKNIESTKKVKSRVTKAVVQLEDRFENGLAKYGLIAVNVSSIIDREKFRDFCRKTLEGFEENYKVLSSRGSYAPQIRSKGLISSIEHDGNFRTIIVSYLSHLAEVSLHSNLGDFRMEDLPYNCWGIMVQATIPVTLGDEESKILIPVRSMCYFLNPAIPEELRQEISGFIRKLGTGF